MPHYRNGPGEAAVLNYQKLLDSVSPRDPKRSTAINTNSSNNSRQNLPEFYSGMHRVGSTTVNSTYDNRTKALFGYKKTSYHRLPMSSYIDTTYHYNSSPINSAFCRNSSNCKKNHVNSTFDLSKYSPHNYVPNVKRSGPLTTWASTGSSLNLSNSISPATIDLLDRDELNYERLNYHAQKSVLNEFSNWSTPLLLSSGKSPINACLNSKTYSLLEGSNSTGRLTGSGRLTSIIGEYCGLNGLRNIGNTCFMNSVIQCLSNTRPLLEYLLDEQYLNDINLTTSSMKGSLIKAFSEVIRELWEHKGGHVVSTSTLKSQIQRFAPQFMGYYQQDAQEFLRYLLEGLHEDVNHVTTKPQSIFTDIPDHYSEIMKATENWKQYLRSENSTIVDLFVGQLRSSLRCTVCNYISVTLDPFWDLSLPITTRLSSVKLSQCLEYFTREEVLDGDEKPTCSRCQMRRKCTKSFSIQKFPKILVIHLKRFSPMEGFRGKLNVLVDFPLTGLELSAFAAVRMQNFTYRLYGVVNHSGTTQSGHYTAYCKHPYSSDWHEYNDNQVSSVPTSSVVSSEAYVLFYEQQLQNSHL